MSSSSGVPAPAVPGLDLADAMTQLGVTWEEMKELLETFPAAVRREMGNLRAAGTLEATRFAAHALAGLAGNYRAKTLYTTAKALESAARENREAEVPELLEKVSALADEAIAGAETALKH